MISLDDIQLGVGQFFNFVEDNYTDLITLHPSATIGMAAYVVNSQGTEWWPSQLGGGDFYPEGIYIWSGSDWISDRNSIADALNDNLTIVNTVDPTITDDSSLGYKTGRNWINTVSRRSFFLLDSAVGAAVWIKVAEVGDLGLISGIITGGDVTINVGDDELFDVEEGTGVVVDWIVPSSPNTIKVAWDDMIGVAMDDASKLFTTLCIDPAGDLQQTPGALQTPELERQNIILDSIEHVNGVNITDIAPTSIQAYQATNAINDYITELGPINKGNIMDFTGVGRAVQKSAGSTTIPWISRKANPQNPAKKSNDSQTPLLADKWFTSYESATNVFTTTLNITATNPDLYNPTPGALVSVSVNKWTVKRFYFFGKDDRTIETYGRAEYNSKEQAIANAFLEAPVIDPLVEDNGILTTILVMKAGATWASGDFEFFIIGGQTTQGGGGAGAQDMQATYNLSTEPEILTDATRGALSVQRGSAVDTDNIYEGKNGSAVIIFSVTGEGCIAAQGLDIVHTALEDDDHAIEIDCSADGHGDVKALDIDYITGDIEDGQDEAVILTNIDRSVSTGGDVSALEVLATEGDAKVNALLVGADVNPVQQLSGTFSNMDSALVNATDRLTEFTTIGSDIQMFVADDDTVTIGSSIKFQEIEFLLAVFSSQHILPVFEFSTGVGTWTAFSPVDGTNGMRNNGIIAWLDGDIPAWAIGTGSEYLIRITRTRNNVNTPPTESIVQIVAGATEYSWDKDGNVSINDILIRGFLKLSFMAEDIVSGEVTVTGSRLAFITEGGAGTDDLDTINGVPSGTVIYVKSNNSDTVVLKDGTGNLDLGSDIPISGSKVVQLIGLSSTIVPVVSS